MSDNSPVVTTPEPDFVWGAAAIGKIIGRGPRAAFHMLEKDVLPARKVGGRWCASAKALRGYVGGSRTEKDAS